MTTNDENWANDYNSAAMEGLVDDPRFVGGDDGFGEIDFDSDGVDSERIGSGDARQQVTRPGWYHMKIEAKARPLPYGNGIKADEDMDRPRRPDILLTFTVLKTVDKQDAEGHVMYHNLILGGKGGGAPSDIDKSNTLNVLVGLGICQKIDGKVIDPETKTTRINTRTLEARLNAVKHCVCHVQVQKGKEKSDKPGEYWDDQIGLIWGRGAFLPNDPKVATVPRSSDPQYAVKPITPPQTAKDGEPRRDANSASRAQPVSANELDDLQV